MAKQSGNNRFQKTLNLPKTDFSIRANSQKKEPEVLDYWEKEEIAQKAMEKNKGKEKFILHDGPPYANGHLHLGHALTYILKDIVCKAKRMSGFYTPLVPGWDCHGLPIELKVAKDLGIEKDPKKISGVEFKKHCRKYAQHWIGIQEKELKGLGKFADYQNAYLTMNSKYEADILRAFAVFVERGHIERKLKTVSWCASCQTVLATAEIEYQDRTDPSIYVSFSYSNEDARLTFPILFEENPNLKLDFVIWTTTPWTLPLNRAVVLNPSAPYVVLQGKTKDQGIIVASQLAEKVCSEIGIEKIELAEADAVAFKDKFVKHPFVDGLKVPLISDELVSLDTGTACLHSAPGCGPEDYLLGSKHNLEIFSPLSSDGKYTDGIQPTELEGKSIVEGNRWVLEKLQSLGALLHQGKIVHSYPHCWRCHKGLMFRATNQWFCDLKKNDLIDRALAEIEKIQFVPERGKARLHAFISQRGEWCLSRQRQWGVPIPAILCNSCGGAILTADFVRGIADQVAKEGIEFWDRMTVQELIKLGILKDDFCCTGCGSCEISNFCLERDILDVWFDSGVSSYTVLQQDKMRLGVPAEAYFEGSDQHRGWFQSSLLCGMVLFDQTPTKSIITHGFIVDEHKRKMSKSLGNVVLPQDVIKKFSRDVLRLWVASTDFEGDLVISDTLLSNVAEMYRKIRNTCRFLIANLYDFDINKDAVELNKMLVLDQHALAQLYELNKKVRESYNQYRFSSVVQAINNYCTNDLSAVYFDILKDRLYVEKQDGFMRRSAQTALFHILDGLTHLLAPILSFLSEEVSDFYQKDKQNSIHLQDFTMVIDVWKHLASFRMQELPIHLKGLRDRSAIEYIVQKGGQWNMLEMLRDAVLKAIELKREEGVIKHSYEARVKFFVDPESKEYKLLSLFMEELQVKKENIYRFLKDWFVVSRADFAQTADGLGKSTVPWAFISVERAAGVKCPRCWQWSVTEHEEGLCERCESVIE